MSLESTHDQTAASTVVCGGSAHRPWTRISLPRHDLLVEERWLNSQRRRARSLFLNGILLHRNTGCIHKAQSLPGSKDQTMDNIQRTLRAYPESGSEG